MTDYMKQKKLHLVRVKRDNEQLHREKNDAIAELRETLIGKYEVLRANNLILQKRIMQLVSPCEDKSEFPEIEDIRNLFDTLRKQYFTDVCILIY